MALLGIIRRWHIRDQVPLKDLARRLGISRNTVRRYLRSDTIEPAYAERRSKLAIDQYAFQLSAMLKTEEARSRKQRRTLKQIHEDLKELGFEGAYDRGAAFARTWREGQIDRINSARKRTRQASIGAAVAQRVRRGAWPCRCGGGRHVWLAVARLPCGSSRCDPAGNVPPGTVAQGHAGWRSRHGCSLMCATSRAFSCPAASIAS